ARGGDGGDGGGGAVVAIIYCDKAERVADILPPESVQTVVTSPPYFGLRDYGVDGQIGLEQTPEEYVAKLVEVFRGIRKVLRPDGTVWLNLGDRYWNSNGFARASAEWQRKGRNDAPANDRRLPKDDILKVKDLIGIPWRVAFALQADGWYLRSDIIWHKPNPMPESVTDRPTRAHEYVFLLSKSPRYFYDADAIREPSKYVGRTWKERKEAGAPNRHGLKGAAAHKDSGFAPGALGSNKRSVWTIATQPFPEAHFATFPEKLVEPCILAGTSPHACPFCRAPWKRVVERTGVVHRREPAHDPRSPTKVDSTGWKPARRPTDLWEPTCTCEGNDGSGKCIVLDPFAGSGTTLLVAERLGRQAVGIEINPEYVEMAKRRLSKVQLAMPL